MYLQCEIFCSENIMLICSENTMLICSETITLICSENITLICSETITLICNENIVGMYTPVPLMRVALVGEVGYNAVVPWIPNIFPLNVQFPHINFHEKSHICAFFRFRYVISDDLLAQKSKENCCENISFK